MIDPDRRIAADWLALRRRADTAARDRARHLVDRVAALRPATAVDVGAGTGANHAYLAPLLPATDWLLLDHDADLLGAAPPGAARVVGGVEALGALVAAAATPVLVTCSALLDLLDADQLAGLADVLARPGVVGLFALTVDGRFTLDPPHPVDHDLVTAFNAHQRRDARPGPDAAAHLAGLCRERGLTVEASDTPWVLEASDGALLVRLLRERAVAASEADPGRRADFAAWLAARERYATDGVLRVEVGHVDLLVRPATPVE